MFKNAATVTAKKRDTSTEWFFIIIYLLSNIYYLVANIGFDTAKNEPRHVRCTIRAGETWFGIVSVLGLAPSRIWSGRRRHGRRSLISCRSGRSLPRAVNASRSHLSPTPRRRVHIPSMADASARSSGQPGQLETDVIGSRRARFRAESPARRAKFGECIEKWAKT